MACLFCKIASGDIPSEKIAETETAFAFLDISPLARGHVLVIPKQHAERFEDLSGADAAGMIALAQDIARRQANRFGAPGVTIAINNGRAAGQEVMHVHMHLVPRHEGDNFGPIHTLFTKRPELRTGELKEIGARLRG